MMPFVKLPNSIMQNLKVILKTGGGFSETTGIYEDGTTSNNNFIGAIFPLSMDDMQFDKGGTYSKNTAKLYTYNLFQNGQEILDNNNVRFRILQSKDYTPYAGRLNIYYINRVGDTLK
jgi:hypothetical protein